IMDGDDLDVGATPTARTVHQKSLTGFGISWSEETHPPPPYAPADTELGKAKREIVHIITCLEGICLDEAAVAEHKDPLTANYNKPAATPTASSGSFIDDESESFATDEDGNSRLTHSK